MALLGLMTAEQLGSTYRPKNIRRKIFYMYPNGSAPLLGLLSLMKDEVTNDPEFKWYEERLSEQRTTLANISTTVVFYSSVSSDFLTWTTATGDITVAAGTQYGIKVASSGTTQFRVGHIIKIMVIDSAVATVELFGHVTYVDATNNRMAFIAVNAPTNAVDYDAANAGKEVLVVGTAAAEGAQSVSSTAALSTLEVYNTPVQPYNYTQIHTANWQITGTAGKTAVWFDTRGVSPDQSKQAAVNLNRNFEFSFIFGQRYERVVSATNVTRFTGGILYFLALWEAGSTYGNTAATSDTDDTKRIIENSTGSLSLQTYESVYLERAFRHNRNSQNELMCFCGTGAMAVLAQMYKGTQTFTAQMPSKETYGMAVVAHMTSFGTVYYKTHPLFNMNSTLRYNMLFTDVTCLKYRPLAGRDTTLKQNQQPNNADYVEDGFIAECGAEINSPESHLYIKNVQNWQA